jgi:hypothetical protein
VRSIIALLVVAKSLVQEQTLDDRLEVMVLSDIYLMVVRYLLFVHLVYIYTQVGCMQLVQLLLLQ